MLDKLWAIIFVTNILVYIKCFVSIIFNESFDIENSVAKDLFYLKINAEFFSANTLMEEKNKINIMNMENNWIQLVFQFWDHCFINRFLKEIIF